MTCTHDIDLEAFVAGRLTPDELARVEEALDRCAACRHRLGALARQLEGRADTPDLAGAELDAGLFEADPFEPDPFELGPDPLVGTVLGGRYRVLRRLGSGGMGAVYEAEHEHIGRRVALKLLHAELATRREVLQRFRNEARAAGAIGHPGIVQALDVGRTEAGAPFLVLELLVGEDLEASLARRGPLPVGDAVEIGIAVADAVAAAHALGIVHRDLKPANVFLCESGAAKVLDFGISKVRGALQTSPDTRSGMILGTPAYMAPEQLQDASRADARSDVYALGAILYRVLSGALPHAATSLPALLAGILVDPVVPLRERRPEVPEGLDALVVRALAPLPDDRPSTMIELRDALRSFGARRRTTVRPLEATGERRAVVALVASGVDHDDFTRAVEDAGGKALAGATPRAIFGDESWSGEVVTLALRVAYELAARPADGVATVVVGPASLAGGELMLAAETVRALDALEREPLRGAFVAPSLMHAGGEGLGVEVVGELRRLVARTSTSARRAPLIGRGAELARIDEALDAALAESCGTVVWIDGPPGIGKSRLLTALETRIEDAHPGTRILRARASARSKHSDLALLRALLLDAGGIDARAAEPLRRALVAALAATAFDADAASREASLAELLDVGSQRSPGDARYLADRARLIARDALEGLARHRPLALLIDDAQWADLASLGLLGDLVERLADERVLIAIAARPELRDEASLGWLASSEVVRVHPRPLRRHEVRRLVEGVLGGERAESAAAELAELSGGNPFFAEQLAWALASGFGRGLDRRLLPPTIEGAVQARLDGLGPDAREAIRRAAVLGDEASAADLEGLGVEGAAELLESLEHEGLVRRTGRIEGETARYELATPLLAEAAYRMLGDDARRELHRLAAAMLEAHRAPELVASHYERGGMPRRAAELYARAALEASRRADASATEELGERAIALGPSAADRFDVLEALAEANEVRGRLGERERVLAEADPLAPSPARRAAVRTQRAVALQRIGRSDEALETFEHAVADAEESDDPVILARALGKRSAALVYAGQLAEAAETLARAERLVWTRAGELRAEAAVWRAQLAAASGDLGDRRNAYWAAVELYREMGDRRRHAGASVNLADVYNRVGAFDEAIPALESALAACREVGMRVMEGYALVNLGYALLGAGELERAGGALGQAAAIAIEVGEERLRLVAELYQAKVALADGRPNDACTLASHVVVEAEARSFRGVVALALATEARAELGRGAHDRALDRARRALAIRDELGGLEEEDGSLFLVLAEACDSAGHGREAAEARARGRAIVSSAAARIGDAHWRERFVTDVPSHRTLLEAQP